MLRIRLNPDCEMAATVKSKVIANDGYCPCRLQKTPATKCMCEDFRNQQTAGLCHCKLYEKYEDESTHVTIS